MRESRNLANGKLVISTVIDDALRTTKFERGSKVEGIVGGKGTAAGLLVVNTNTGNPIATDTEYKAAGQTIYHNRDYPSHVILPVFKE